MTDASVPDIALEPDKTVKKVSQIRILLKLALSSKSITIQYPFCAHILEGMILWKA